LLASAGPVPTLERLAVLRAPAYEAVADATVETDERDVDEVAAVAIEELRACDA
jgi:hypothetical protein